MADIPNINKTRISVVTKPTNVSVSTAGIQGRAGEIQDLSSLNDFTASYYIDSASIVNLIQQATNEQDLSNYALLSGSNFFIGVQNIFGAVTTTGSLFVSGSTVQIGNNTLIGRTELSGSISISGSTEFGGDLVPLYARGATIGTEERPFRDIYLQSASINISSDIIGGRRATISNADGNVTIQAAGFQLKSASFVSFEVSEDARTKIRVPQIPAGDIGAFSIIGNSSGSYQPVTNAGGLIHLTGNDGLASRITSDAFGTTALVAYVGRKARGTAANPLPVQSNDTLTRISSIGWTGPEYGFTMLSGLTTAPTSLDVIALENFTTSSFGTAYRFFNTPIGNTTRVLSAQIDTDGLIVPNIPTNNTATQVLVWDSVSGRIGKQSGANNLDGGAAASVYLSVTEELNGGGA